MPTWKTRQNTERNQSMNPNSIDEIENEWKDYQHKSEVSEETLIHETLTGELDWQKKIDF